MKAFVDTSAWFAAANTRDRHHQRASELLRKELEFVTSTYVVVETWLLLQSRISFAVAEGFVDHVMSGAATLEHTSMSDIQRAWKLPAVFKDQTFSLVDRTSFVMMERLDISKVISFDADFLVYRYGANRERAFEVLR
jgi:predicted nucleic acid-binding protein